MEISVVGTSFRTAPVHVRERLARTEDLARQLMRACLAEGVFEECLVLSTCNRTEVYSVTRDGRFSLPHLLRHIARLKGTDAVADASHFYRRDGLSAVAHLLRVTASLDSQIVGEHEILGQVKDAFRWATEAGTARFLLGRLMQRALRTGKRVRTETGLGAGCASVPGAAVDLALHVFSGLRGKTVLLVGAGRTAELAARALMRAGAGGLIVANRTLSRAQELATRLADSQREPEGDDAPPCPALHGVTVERPLPAARAIALSEVPSVIESVDLVISSTGAPDYVLHWDALCGVLRAADRPVLMVDIAVPRDIDPRLGELSNVFLYNIDDLDRLVEENLQRRRREIPPAEAIVRHEVEQFGRWLERLAVVPTIKLLQRRLEQLRLAEMDRRRRQFSAADEGPLDTFSRALCKKILHAPLAYLHKLSENGSSTAELEALELIRQMFDLDSLEEEP